MSAEKIHIHSEGECGDIYTAETVNFLLSAASKDAVFRSSLFSSSRRRKSAEDLFTEVKRVLFLGASLILSIVNLT